MPIAGRLNRIEDNSVTTAKLVDDAVTTAKITDANVTKAKTETAIDDNIPLAWVSFKGTSTVTIEDDFNVSSITDQGQGRYDINLSNGFANSNKISLACFSFIITPYFFCFFSCIVVKHPTICIKRSNFYCIVFVFAYFQKVFYCLKQG